MSLGGQDVREKPLGLLSNSDDTTLTAIAGLASLDKGVAAGALRDGGV
jgi:hypothetical protein